MKVKTAIIALLLICTYIFPAFAAEPAKDPNAPPKSEAEELEGIVLHSFEHFDYLDILYKLKGHDKDVTWIVLFYIDEDHHKDERDRIKKLIFKDHPDFKYAEANISKPNYAPIRKVIKFPTNANERDFPMILVMKNEIGQMAYGPGVARKAADIVDALIKKEAADKAAAEAAAKAGTK
jgi:hypothetical protein